MCLLISIVSFNFTSLSTAFERFSRGIFGLLVLNFFFQISDAQIRDEGFNQKNKNGISSSQVAIT